jgi:hypothetical protein
MIGCDSIGGSPPEFTAAATVLGVTESATSAMDFAD